LYLRISTMAGITGNGKLRQWLIEQVDTGKYPGLMWEDSEKTTFRIPWKHAGKQDYNRDEDAALFKAWALFKGKYREGIDKPDPPTWKTRLRCALNKSNDFEELGERSQLDTSDPYKVYRVIPEGTKRGYQISGSFYNCSAYDPPASLFNLDQCIRSAEALALSDPRLQVSVFNGDTLVREVTVLGVGGCRLAPYEEIQGYGIPEGPELVPLPQGEGGELEHGVLIWMAPDGLCARRLCDARVYWEGTHVPYTDKPGKLERDQISKLLDTQLFLTELQCCYLQTRPPPRFQVVLFFEESQGTHTQRRSITVQVRPHLS
ncbi:hypothetical protein P4O66_019778, partial [Electrophorus voltai]